MEKKQYENYVSDSKLDLALLTKDLNSLTIEERKKLFKGIRDLVNKYLKMDFDIKCANSGHEFGDWAKREELNSNGLENGLPMEKQVIYRYYRICKICGYEQFVYSEPAEFRNQEIEKEIQFHMDEIAKLEKQKVKK